MFGRNFGLFGFDAIINDMTLPGVGVAGSARARRPLTPRSARSAWATSTSTRSRR